MSERKVTKTIENVDELFSKIIVNGEEFNSAKFTQSEAPQIIKVEEKPQPLEEEVSADPAASLQGEDVYAVELNDVHHKITDIEAAEQLIELRGKVNTEIRDRAASDAVLDSKIAEEASTRSASDTSLYGYLAELEQQLAVIQGNIETVKKLIPSQASEDNQLADKDFVNSSIATNTAYFVGTFDSVAELPSEGVTNNDYAFVKGVDSEGNQVYKRYKYNSEDSEWMYEFDLNNSSFTAEQWATINSGLTASSLDDLVPNTRKVNGKALSSDVTLDASDVGALALSEGKVNADVDFLGTTKYKGNEIATKNEVIVTEYVTFPTGTSLEEILKQLCERSTNNKSYIYNVINEGWGFTLTVVLSNRSGFCCGTATNTYDNYSFRMWNTDRPSFALKKLALTENIFDARKNNVIDCNKQVESGVFTVNPSTLNQPYGNYGILFVYGENSDIASGNDQWVFQRLETTSGYIYIRYTVNPNSLTPPASAWTEWKEIPNINNLVPTHGITQQVGNFSVDKNTPYSFTANVDGIFFVNFYRVTGGFTIHVDFDGKDIFGFPNYSNNAISGSWSCPVKAGTKIEIYSDGVEQYYHIMNCGISY